VDTKGLFWRGLEASKEGAITTWQLCPYAQYRGAGARKSTHELANPQTLLYLLPLYYFGLFEFIFSSNNGFTNNLTISLVYDCLTI